MNNPNPEEIFVLPMSFGQERFWWLDHLNPGNPTWMVPVRFHLQGALNSAFVVRAFNEIVRRHEPLRATFKLADGQPVQVIKPSVEIGVPVIDLRHLPKQERDLEVDRISFEEARRGFDLAIGPLFRVSLLRVEDNGHVLLVTPHHSVADYWSIGLISAELGALYEAYSRNAEPVLPELSIQYGDFAVWQREQAEGAVVQKELAYWKEQLKNLPLLEFPTGRPRPDFLTYNATITSILLPVSLTDAMKDIANRAGATFFNTMLAALGIVLHQYTGQTDFGVATQVAGRTSVELEPLIGLFINTVALRLDLAGDLPFTQLLARVQDVGLQSLANQNVRFEQVLKELRPNDYPSHHTLFRVNFICQRDPVKPLEFSGIKLTVIPSKSQGALYDLNVFLVLRTEGWRLACEYNTDLFEASAITRLLADYRKLLESIVRNPDSRVSQFPLCEGAPSAGQKKPAAGVPANGPAGSPAGIASAGQAPPRSLGAAAAAGPVIALDAASATASSSPAFSEERFVMPTSGAQRRFWALEEMVPGNPALHMRACVRLTGSISLVTLERSFQLLVDRHEMLRTVFERLGDELVQVIAPPHATILPVTSIGGVTEDGREKALWAAIRAEASAPFDLVRGPLIRARLYRLGAQEHVLVITTHHILADGWSQNVIQRDLWAFYEALAGDCEPSLPPLAIQYGDFVHWQQKWLASDCARQQIDFWKKQLASPLPVLNLPAARPARNRAAAQGSMETLLLPEDLVQSLKSLSKSQDATMFMVTLAAYSALLNRYTGQEDILVSSPVANRRPETESLIGPFAGPVPLRVDLSGNPKLSDLLGRVRDITLNALSHADLPFEVLLEKLDIRSVRGRSPLSECYFFYQTAFLQPRQLPALTVTPLPDFGLGTHFELQMGLLERREGVRAQLEYNPGLFEAATIKEILRFYEALLRAFVADSERRLSDLPLLAEARSQHVQPVDLSQSEIALPQDDTEKRLTRIWESLLRVKPLGRRQNYFELGGNSLSAVGLFAEIEKEFGMRLPLSTLIEAQTIEEVARLLRGNTAAANWSPLVEIQPGGSRPPFFCVHSGGGNVLVYRDLSRRLGPDQPFYGLQSQGLDGEQPLLTRIEDMAELYAKEVRRVQPHGPYLFGGYCLGGTIALEMAQQFRAQGEEVALLAFFDTLNWSKLSPGNAWKKLCYQAQRLAFHAGNFLLLNSKDKLEFLQGKLDALRSRSSVWRGALLGRLIKERPGNQSESLLLARIWQTNDRAALNYVPRPYPGVITDFRPMKQYMRYKEPGVHWDDLALDGQEIVTLPVYPAGMLLEPFVQQLAAALTASIDRATQAASFARAAGAESAPHHQEIYQ